MEWTLQENSNIESSNAIFKLSCPDSVFIFHSYDFNAAVSASMMPNRANVKFADRVIEDMTFSGLCSFLSLNGLELVSQVNSKEFTVESLKK